MKKALLILAASLWLATLAGTYVATRHHYHKPTPLANNTLRWVRDPNTGTQYYGWYEPDGSAFNSVATAGYNKRMGSAEPTTVPVHQWQRVN